MKFAMVFPGQGSQSVGMLTGYGDAPVIRETLAEASDILKQDVGKLMAEGPAEELNNTVNTQPVMVIAGICAWRLWRDLGGAEPSLLAGHSLGEYTALVAAGAISFSDCLPLVRLRAQAMQEAVPQGKGAMAAILGLEDEVVRAVCAEAAEGEVQHRQKRDCAGGAKEERSDEMRDRDDEATPGAGCRDGRDNGDA